MCFTINESPFKRCKCQNLQKKKKLCLNETILSDRWYDLKLSFCPRDSTKSHIWRFKSFLFIFFTTALLPRYFYFRMIEVSKVAYEALQVFILKYCVAKSIEQLGHSCIMFEHCDPKNLNYLTKAYKRFFLFWKYLIYYIVWYTLYTCSLRRENLWENLYSSLALHRQTIRLLRKRNTLQKRSRRWIPPERGAGG